MSGQHTPTPWVMDMDEDSDYWLVGNNQPYGIVSNPVVKLHNEDNARRIVACVNALEHISTEQLESGKMQNLVQRCVDAEQQRDELLAAFNLLANDVNCFIEGSISSFQLNKTLELATKARDSQC